jgi:hypothetical protein
LNKNLIIFFNNNNLKVKSKEIKVKIIKLIFKKYLQTIIKYNKRQRKNNYLWMKSFKNNIKRKLYIIYCYNNNI